MRDSVAKDIVDIKENMLLELPTGFGKTAIAIERVKNISEKGNILIVIPRNVLKSSWQKELQKWWKDCDMNITYTTYISFYKHLNKVWDFVIFDEGHHLSEKCRKALKLGIDNNLFKNIIILSATVKEPLKVELKKIIPDLYVYKVSTKEAINNNVLPDPQVLLIPLELNNRDITDLIVRNPKGKKTIKLPYNRRFEKISKEYKVYIPCTEMQYHNNLCSQIEWYKNKYMKMKTVPLKNKWLHLCGERLRWLSSKKNELILAIQEEVKNFKTLTFCSDIKQTEMLGLHCINSKNALSEKYLEDFNEGKLCHITTCNMLNEGINLNNCKIGIFANLNSSEIMTTQKLGRLLRHEKPVIIIPYYKNTREQELVMKTLENCNKDNIIVVNNKEQLVKILNNENIS